MTNNNSSLNWQIVSLSDVTDYINRGVPPIYTESNLGTAVINQKCIRDGEVSLQHSKLTDESSKPISQEKLIQLGDILINSTGTGTVGRVGQITNLNIRASVDTHVTIVRPKKKIVDSRYLGMWLKSRQKEFENLAEGSSNQVELSKSKISAVKVILPPIDVQQKIGVILSSMEDHIKKTEQIIQKTRILRDGMINELLKKGIDHKKFTKTRIGDIPDEWKVFKLEEVAHVNRGKFSHRPRNDKAFYGGDIPFIQTGDVVNSGGRVRSYSQTLNKKGLSVSRMFPKGTIVITIAANIGDTGILEFDSCFPDSLVGIQPNPNLVDTIYLEYFLRSRKPYLNSIATQSAQKNINLEKLNPLLIVLPDMSEQKKIAAILSEIDKKIDIEVSGKQKMINLKSGMMDDIFNQRIEI